MLNAPFNLAQHMGCGLGYGGAKINFVICAFIGKGIPAAVGVFQDAFIDVCRQIQPLCDGISGGGRQQALNIVQAGKGVGRHCCHYRAHRLIGQAIQGILKGAFAGNHKGAEYRACILRQLPKPGQRVLRAARVPHIKKVAADIPGAARKMEGSHRSMVYAPPELFPLA